MKVSGQFHTTVALFPVEGAYDTYWIRVRSGLDLKEKKKFSSYRESNKDS